MKYLPFVWKNLIRKKVRTILTVLTILITFLLYGLLSALNHGFQVGIELYDDERLLTVNRSALMPTVPLRYAERIRQLDGVKHVTHQSWFSGYYREPREGFGTFAVDLDSYLKVFPETQVPQDQLENWKNNRIGVGMGTELAARFGWKIGDRIPIISEIYTRNGGDSHWEFELEALFPPAKEGGGNLMLFHYDYFDEARDFSKGEVGWISISVLVPEQAHQVAKRIDAEFENSSSETRTDVERAYSESFYKQFGDIALIIKLILSAVFFTMLFVTGNTMAEVVRERVSEFAILKAIGFSDLSILLQILCESVLMAVIGGVLGIVFGQLLSNMLAAEFSAMLPGFRVTAEAMLYGLVLAVAFGFLAGFVPAVKAMRLSIADALKR